MMATYVLVVVDRAIRRLVVTSVNRSLQVADVKDVGGRVVNKTSDLSRRRSSLVQLVKLVVEEEEGHGLINDPTLVRVCIADVRSGANDSRVLLVGGVIDG